MVQELTQHSLCRSVCAYKRLPIWHILYMSTLHIGRYYILASNYVPSAILHSPQVCGQRNCVNYKALHNMHMCSTALQLAIHGTFSYLSFYHYVMHHYVIVRHLSVYKVFIIGVCVSVSVSRERRALEAERRA